MAQLTKLWIPLLAIIAAGWWAYTGPAFLSEPESLSVLPQALDFGTVVEQERFEWKLPITNNTNHQITIARFERSCKCTRIMPEVLEIAPHSTATLNLAIDLSKTTQSDAPKPGDAGMYGDFVTMIRPVVDLPGGCPQRSLEWRIRGKVRKFLALSSYQIDFETSIIKGEAPPQKSLQVKVDESVKHLDVACTSREFEIAVHRGDPSSRSFSVLVKPLDSVPQGQIQCALSIAPILKDGTKGTALTIPLAGTVVEDISVSPPKLYLGKASVGTPISGEVCLTSRSNKPFVILADESLDPALEPRSKEACARQALRMTVVPHSHGLNTSITAVKVCYHSSGAVSSVPIKYAYLGIE